MGRLLQKTLSMEGQLPRVAFARLVGDGSVRVRDQRAYAPAGQADLLRQGTGSWWGGSPSGHGVQQNTGSEREASGQVRHGVHTGGEGGGGGKGGGRGRGALALVTFASGAAGGAWSGADASDPGGGSTSHSGGRDTQFQPSVGTARCHISSSHAAGTPVNSADITGITSAWGSWRSPRCWGLVECFKLTRAQLLRQPASTGSG